MLEILEMLEIYLFTLIRSQLSNQLKYFKRGWNRKEGRGHKYFEKGGKQGQGVGVLKGEAGTPLQTMMFDRLHNVLSPFCCRGGGSGGRARDGCVGGLSIQPNFQKQWALQDLNF